MGSRTLTKLQLPASHITKLQLSTDSATVVRSVDLLLAFASTVIPGFNILEIHDQYLWWFGRSFRKNVTAFIFRVEDGGGKFLL
jgi:hypothetical protein